MTANNKIFFMKKIRLDLFFGFSFQFKNLLKQ